MQDTLVKKKLSDEVINKKIIVAAGRKARDECWKYQKSDIVALSGVIFF